MTIPTISEIKGNTLLELFKNGYNALKNAITGKQNKLTAGSNIVITEDNVISAIEGGQAVLDNYYTKQEVDGIVDTATESLEDDIQAVANELPDMTQYYDKTEVDNKLAVKANASDVYSKSYIDAINAVALKKVYEKDFASTETTSGCQFSFNLEEGDVIVFTAQPYDETIKRTSATLIVPNIDTTNIVNNKAIALCGIGSSSSVTLEEFFFELSNTARSETSTWKIILSRITTNLTNRSFEVISGRRIWIAKVSVYRSGVE